MLTKKRSGKSLRNIICMVLAVIMVITFAGCGCSFIETEPPVEIKNGLSAYEIAVDYGYEGTIEEWIVSLNGKSAYEIAKENGYNGTEEEWIAALNAAANQPAVSITTAKFSDKGELILVLSNGSELNVGVAIGADGKDGVGITDAAINEYGQLVITYSDGRVVNLDKLVGENGKDGVGISKSEINAAGELVITYTNGQQANLGCVVGTNGLNGTDGKDGVDGISISSATINDAGELVITYSNNTTQNLGKIVGNAGTNGEDGKDGTDGRDGISVTGAEINSNGELVLTFSNGQRTNLGIVIGSNGTNGEDGKDGINGEDGEDGKDGISVIKSEINAKGELVITYSDGRIDNLGKVVGTDGKDGEDGKDGVNGTDGKDGADGVGIQNISVSEAGELQIVLTNGTELDLGVIKGTDGAAGTDGKDGADGEDGRSVTSTTINNAGELVITFSDNTSTNLGKVVGANGSNGANGEDGKDGISVTNTEINENGELVISFSDNTSKNLGKVIGTNGKDGINGEDGKDGIDGTNGKDGIGIAKAEINASGELVLTFSDNTDVNLGKVVGADGANGNDGVGIETVILSENGELSVKLTSGAVLNLGNVKGEDGLGISKSEINENGELVITYSDATFVNLGKVIGRDGEDGVGVESVTVTDGVLKMTLTNGTILDLGNIRGPQGDKGDKGDKGDTGAQGVGIANAYVNDQLHLIIVLTDGTEIDAGYVGVAVTPTNYTVVFKDYDGTILKTETVESGTAATAPTAPSRDGYTFTGWDKAFNNITADTVITATYTQNAPTVKYYTVTFVDYNGTVLKTQSVEEGTAATAPTDPKREGYNFTGWDETFSNITADLVVTATYTKLVTQTYTVTFVDDDGGKLGTETVASGADATPPASPSKSGATFLGWAGNYANVSKDETVRAVYSDEKNVIVAHSVSGTAGGTVTVLFEITGNVKVCGFDFALFYDEGLEIASFDNDLDLDVVFNEAAYENGALLNYSGTSDKTKQRDIIEITFKISDSVSGVLPISLVMNSIKELDSSDNYIDTEYVLVNGAVTVG